MPLLAQAAPQGPLVPFEEEVARGESPLEDQQACKGAESTLD